MSDDRRSVTLRLPSFRWVGSSVRLVGRGLRSVGSGKAFVAACVIALVLAVLNGYVLFRHHQVDRDAAARADAATSASTRVASMLSYDYRSLDADLAVASGNTTGSFKTKYTKVLDELVGPNARKKKIVTEAQVTDAAVVSGDDQKVEVLVFVTQRTRTGDAREAQPARSRLAVQMEKTSKGWFVAGFDPV